MAASSTLNGALPCVYPDREKHMYQSDKCYCCSGNLKKILRMWPRKNGPKTCWQKSERYFGTNSESEIQLWRLYELLCQNRALISWNCTMQLNLPALHVTNRFHWYKSLESPWWKLNLPLIEFKRKVKLNILQSYRSRVLNWYLFIYLFIYLFGYYFISLLILLVSGIFID